MACCSQAHEILIPGRYLCHFGRSYAAVVNIASRHLISVVGLGACTHRQHQGILGYDEAAGLLPAGRISWPRFSRHLMVQRPMERATLFGRPLGQVSCSPSLDLPVSEIA